MSAAAIRFAKPIMALLIAMLLTAPALSAQSAGLEAFDGSFRLENGRILTGGRFVEGGRVFYLFLDTDHPKFGGLFERVGDGATLRALHFGPNAESAPRIEIKFLEKRGSYDRMVWRRGDDAPLSGKRIFPHDSRSVRFTSADGTELVGRLLVPRCQAPHPLIVSLHGSGPVNRYGGPYQLFFVRQGMAVLSYDKRGYTDDRETWREPDLAQMSADAVAAIRFAAAQPRIDGDRIGVLGTSQSGWVAPRAAVEAPETDFLIARAGAALTHAETYLHEIRQERRAEGLQGIALDNAMDLSREIYRLAMAGRPIAETDALVAPYLETDWYRPAFGEGPVSGRWSARWWGWAQRNMATTPLPYLERFSGPVLWFLGERDENVPVVSTQAALARAFAVSPGDDQEVRIIPRAPHSFIVEGEGGALQLSDLFFGGMAEWLAARRLSDTNCWQARR